MRTVWFNNWIRESSKKNGIEHGLAIQIQGGPKELIGGTAWVYLYRDGRMLGWFGFDENFVESTRMDKFNLLTDLRPSDFRPN